MKRGFTLIELLVVVLIIGILSGVALPQYEKAVMKSRYSNLMAPVNALGAAEELYYMAAGEYTDDFEALDIAPGGCTLSADKQTCTYDWGSCKLDSSGNDRVACVNNTSMKNGYAYYFKHGAYADWGRSCWALTADRNDKYAKLCESMSATFVKNSNFPPYGTGFLYKF
ncbi:type IV pilin protein [Candidatus Avelusimicrobium faecicola]|uniref:type IV pilin protein n=1 Tax=Candidatus Avelusimicrobium faecicola TaxID=3416205 RepID=UPI003D101DDA